MFEIKGYRTHEDEQYGRAERLSVAKTLGGAVSYAKDHMNNTRDYQTMVYEDGVLRYAFRRTNEGKVRGYTFYHCGGKIFNSIEDSLQGLITTLGDYYVRASLYEKDGKVVLFDEFNGEYICDDVFGVGREMLADDVTKVIETAYDVLGKAIDKSISKIHFLCKGTVNKLYVTPSKEYGAVDVYLDYF